MAEQHDLWIDVIDDKRATEMGMGMFMAVGRGSDNPPRMIVVRSGGEGEKDALGRHLAIVGKGVCFDSGGISIKPSDRMEEMKMDKAGACTVLAAAKTVARLAPGTPLLAVAPAVENMPGPHSTRPGDIVTALNGKKVDITNTDAEGRLILGDAMTYAERLGATHVVDTATLTGAVGRALGHLVTGAFGQPQAFYDDVMVAAERAGERYWQLPLIEDYVTDMDSWYGDLQNSGSAEGSLDQERAVPARVRHATVGPPRHRRHRLPAQGDAVGAPWRHRRLARNARRAGPRRRPAELGPARRVRPTPRGTRLAGHRGPRRDRAARSSASAPIVSPSAGLSTIPRTPSTRLADRSAGGPWSWSPPPRSRLRSCPRGSPTIPLRSHCSGRGSSRSSSALRPTSTSGCSPMS